MERWEREGREKGNGKLRLKKEEGKEGQDVYIYSTLYMVHCKLYTQVSLFYRKARTRERELFNLFPNLGCLMLIEGVAQEQ